MVDKLSRGELVVARGKLARVQQEFSHQNIRVKICATKEVLMVARRDIEKIDEVEILQAESSIETSLINCTTEQLSLAADRFNIIKTWRAGKLPIAEACSILNISKSFFYKLNRKFNEELGPISIVLGKRGMKEGVTRLSEAVETIIDEATKKIYNSTGASYSKVWVEVDVVCREQGIPSPCKDTVLRRVKTIMPEKKRVRTKHGSDVASQKYSARPGKINLDRPLQWVQMDHTLVNIILLADDRINVIGRPWWTVLIDVKTRVILGYYLSLHVPSATSVACALTHSVLPKSTFVTKVGLTLEDYPYYGKPEVLHMDNAAEFTSPKFKAGCAAFDIHPEYRPIGKKHYGGHVESLIGTFMTTKVHLLKGTTMSNTVARGKLDSDRAATMTFSDFARWFAQEVTVYHSTIHSELGTSPRQAWTEYFAPNGGVPYPPRISDPEQLRLYFMPEEARMINPYGICLHGNIYWDPVLTAHVGTANAIVKFDPFNLNEIWVKLNGRFSSIRLSDLTLQVQGLEDYRASKFFRLPVRVGTIDDDVGRSAYREKQKIEKQSASLTRKARRQQAAEKEYQLAYPQPIIDNLSPRQPPDTPDYSVAPKRFSREDGNE